jgi:hypothetical protein
MKQWPYLIHRLVLLAFVGQAPKGLECRHLDGNPKNNRLENLCWGSSQEQADDRKRHGTNVGNRGRTKGFHYNQGESSGNAKMTERLVIKIRKLAARGCPCTEIANRYRLHPSTVNAAVLGKTWKHVEGL